MLKETGCGAKRTEGVCPTFSIRGKGKTLERGQGYRNGGGMDDPQNARRHIKEGNRLLDSSRRK